MDERESSFAPGVYLAATPLGDPRDASQRLRELVAVADIIAAEDTRKFHNLTARMGVRFTGKLISFFEANEQVKIDQLLSAVADGKVILVVSDAGMPGISDPGYRLVTRCIDMGVAFSVVPGPSAVTTALLLSGLPSDRFTFEGFLPRKSGERVAVLNSLVREQRTMVFFEAPHRIAASLTDMVAVFGGDRRAAVCREMTKTYEEVVRGGLGELALWAQGDIKGEITLVIGGAPDIESGDAALSEVLRGVSELQNQGLSLKDAAEALSAGSGFSKREIYQAVIAHKEGR